jgi:tetratricopeptide (TPR) repeat protein
VVNHPLDPKSLIPKAPKALRLPRHAWIYPALLIVTFAVYSQVSHFGFLNYDDNEYILKNPVVRSGLTPAGLMWAFTTGYAANWFPLTWISHMADCEIFGLHAGWHHLTNVFLHALAAMLLFAFLERATSSFWRSAFVAFLFVLHPLHVESVAWVAERKDVLSAVFWFLSLLTYVRYAERTTAARYWLVFACFALGLMAKPMMVTLPFVLLLLDVWPLRRTLPMAQRIREKLPLFALSAVVSVITFHVQQAGGAVKALSVFPLGSRVENALLSYVWYIEKTVWPSNLAVHYPFPLQISVWQAAAAGAVLAVITVLVLRARPERPHLAVGWLWFLGTLVPVIGLVQVGLQAHADRYAYIPMVGLAIMLAWSVPPNRSMAVVGAAVCLCFAALTGAQLGYWPNSEILFRHALDVTPINGVAEHNLGAAIAEDPDRQFEALPHLREASHLMPDSAAVHTDLAGALARTRQSAESLEEFRAASRLEPNLASGHYNLGNILVKNGRIAEAIAEYQLALRIEPDYAQAQRNMAAAERDRALLYWTAGISLTKEGRVQEAIRAFEECLNTQPDHAEAHNSLGRLLSDMPGRLPEAISHFKAALRLKPHYSDAEYNLRVAQERVESRR